MRRPRPCPPWSPSWWPRSRPWGPARRHRWARSSSGWPPCCAARPACAGSSPTRTVEANAREGLVRQVFGDKVDRHHAARRGDGRPAPLDGRSRPRRRARAPRRGAVVRSADDAGRLADELFAVARLLNDNPDLRERGRRPGPLPGETGGRCSTACSRARRWPPPRAWSTSRWPAPTAPLGGDPATTRRSRPTSTVSGSPRCASARALIDTELARLQGALTAQYDREVHLNVIVDPRRHRRHPGGDRRRRHRRHRRQQARRRTTQARRLSPGAPQLHEQTREEELK